MSTLFNPLMRTWSLAVRIIIVKCQDHQRVGPPLVHIQSFNLFCMQNPSPTPSFLKSLRFFKGEVALPRSFCLCFASLTGFSLVGFSIKSFNQNLSFILFVKSFSTSFSFLSAIKTPLINFTSLLASPLSLSSSSYMCSFSSSQV